MTTETQPARMGDDLPDWAIAQAFREAASMTGFIAPNIAEGMRIRARELSAHGGDGGGDRAALNYLMQQFDAEVFVCGKCGHEAATKNCDSAIYLRDYLATQQPASGEVFDRALDTSRRRSAVELLLEQGYEWKFDQWIAPAIAAHGGSGEGIEDLCQRLAEHGAKSGRRAATKQYSDGVPTHTEMLMGQAIDAIRRLSTPAYAKVISSQDGLLGRSSTSPIRTRGPGDTGQSDPEFDFDGPTEFCESGDPACGPVEHWDSEGVPLCQACWESCSPFNLPGPKGFDPTPPSSASDAEVEAEYCFICSGRGNVSLGITEAPTTLCGNCDGTGMQPKKELTRSPTRVGWEVNGVLCGMTPGMAKVEFRLDADAIPEWLDFETEVTITQQASP